MKIIALIDCDSFFCNCERLFRPDLKNKPIGVLSNNDGCFVSRTPELKQIGIPMGAPYFKFKDICIKNRINVFSSNFSLYTNISDRLMEELKAFDKNVEPYSVDEAFLDLTDSFYTNFQNENNSSKSHCYQNLEENDLYKQLMVFAYKIKSTISKNIGIPVSIGVGSNKVLAKLATEIAKKDKTTFGVFEVITKKNLNFALDKTPVEDIWGVGRSSSAKLRNLKINTAKDFKEYPHDKYILKLFTKTGLHIKKSLAEEISPESTITFFGKTQNPILKKRSTLTIDSLTNSKPQKKSILCSRSFGKGVYDFESLLQAISNHVSNASSKLRNQKSVCSKLAIFIRTSRHDPNSSYKGHREVILDFPTDDTRVLIQKAKCLLKEIFKPKEKYKKAGVYLSQIESKEHHQCTFNELEFKTETSNKLMSCLDEINKKYGQGTLQVASCLGKTESWKMNRKQHSPRYTNSWIEIPKAK